MHVYFAGLGGIAIGPLALMSLDLGWEVSGSDRETSRYTDILAARNIKVSTDQSGSHLRELHQQKPIDLYIYTSAMPHDHPEIAAARELNIKTAKRDELINRIIQDQNLPLIAVSGTHGKTTTTAMLIWVFYQLEIPIAHLVGTNLSFAPSGQYQKGARYFVYEADEYDRNMLQFQPYVSLIPALDYDHADTYPTHESYIEAFREFASQSGLTITWGSIAKLLGIEPNDKFAALSDSNDLSALHLPGEHNRRNAFLVSTAVLSMLKSGVTGERILEIIERFPGSERRFEKLAEGLYTDYAHHPAEIQATLGLAREVAKEKKIVVVYQPHQNRRQHEIADEYRDCFKEADHLYWLPTYLSREDESLVVLQPKQLIKKLTVKPETEISELNDKLAATIKQHLKDGDLVVVMGAGSVDEWLRQQFHS